MLVALLGATSAFGKTVYIQPSSNWLQDGARFALYMFGGANDAWTNFEVVDADNNIYKATFDDSQTSMIFVRMNGSTTENNWDNKWNQTADLVAPANDNQLYVFGDGWDNPTLTITENYTEPVAAGYTVDFNTAITTSDHAFQVASNWRHIVDTYEDYFSGNTNYPSYSYSETAGVNGSGALSCSTNQNSNGIYDLLVTPVVKGTVTIDAKTTANYWTPQLSFFKIVDNGDNTFTRGDQITVDVSAVNASDYTTITIPVDEAGERIGIRSSYVWLDNFSAEEATLVPEKKIAIASAEPSATTGTIYWEQQANGKVLVSYTVTVTNTGDVDLTQGTEGFSVSIINRGTGEAYATVAVPQDLAIGATSDPFEVAGELETSTWANSYTYINMDLKENLQGSTVQRAQSQYTAYEPKFVFRAAESTATTSISGSQAWGTISESTTVSFEIANTGTAPLTIKSIKLPTGFTSDNAPTAEFTLAKGETQALNITQDATAQGTFAGTLAIVYLDKNDAEQTYSLDFSATVIGANTWHADFNNTTDAAVYPVGAVAESGIRTDYTYSSGTYDYYLYSYTSSSYANENNKFITPKLHANAGDKLAFDVRRDESSSAKYNLKVYVSTDRKTWGDPVYSVTAADLTSSFQTKEISFDAEGEYYVAFAIYGVRVDNIVGLEKVDVAHDLYIKSVSWPDASVKSGTSLSKPSVEVIPLTDEAAEAYTVKYVCGETVLAEGTPVALTTSATSSKTFTFSWTPEVESTTVYENTKVVFDFGGGVTFETEEFDLTVTNEPKFHFVKTLPSSKWYEPTDYTTPITFGKTNTADTQTYYINNWGSAPLTVKSLTLPEGFTTSVEFPLTVAAFNGENDGIAAASQALDLTFSATEAGIYSGDMVITYVNAAGEDATFTLAVSGTKLDPSKWYANFGGESNQWPAGSVYQSNVSTTYVNTGDYAITSTSATDNLFVTPKLVSAGETFTFDAKLYNSYSSWAGGKVVVYAAATREEVLNAEEGTTRTQLFSVSGQDETNPLTTDFQTFEVTVPAGEWYLGIEISNRPYVDELYGLAVAPVAHDLQIASSSVPADATQNVASTATVNVLNLGLTDDNAVVTAYVNGEAVATSEAVALPTTNQLSNAGTQLSVSFRYPKVGTFPVYLEVKAGDYTVTTEAVDVTFAEEVASNEAVTGNSVGVDGSIPVNLYYKNSETIALYTQASLGLNGGEKIQSITWKGYTTSAHTSTLKVYYAWTDETSISKPSSTSNYDVTGMTAAIEPTSHTWTVGGSATELQDQIVVNFDTPITYESGKSLLILVSSSANGYSSSSTAIRFEKSDITGYAYQHQNDGTEGVFTGSWSANNLPLIHLALVAEPTVLTGTVTDGTNAVEGAVVTLVSADGDNVQYTGTTDATGAYSINVIQATRDYNASVEYDGAVVEYVANADLASGVDFTVPVKVTEGTIWAGEPATVTLGAEYFENAQVGDEVALSYQQTVKFTNNNNWSTVNFYAWNSNGEPLCGDWPGTALTNPSQNELYQDLYTVVIPEGAVGIIFNGDGAQTVDITDFNHEGYWVETSTDGNNHYYVGVYGDPVAANATVEVTSEILANGATFANVVKVELVKGVTEVPFSITAAGWASFSNAKAVQLPAGVKAYIATEKNGTDVDLVELTDGVVPAETGVLLKADEGSYTATVVNTDVTYSENLLVAALEAYEVPIALEGRIYAFGQYQGLVGFVLAEAGYEVAAGKAYLLLSTPSAKPFISIAETTGINGVNVNALDGQATYNLQGQRVNGSQRGVVIRGGKKYIVK